MAYWDSLTQLPSYAAYVKEKNHSNAFSAHYPEYEQTTPQYTAPSPYSLAQQGYRTNTLIYACIDKRMRAISAAPMFVYNVAGTQPTVANDIIASNVLHNPNERMSEKQFWQVTQMYLDIAGSSPWEIERNHMGDPIRLWPMRPDWCSYLRGNGRPLRAVRYQPYGLPFQDIPIEDVLLFQYYDPLYPMLKGFSPTMTALKDIAVDNGMSQFLLEFILQGARFSGLLTTEQDLDDIEAQRIKDRWKSQHGGVDNWNNIAVLGHGATYQNTSQSFNDMAFPELDGRTEARICMAFDMPPILLGAKVGLKASTFTNYEQARKAWYEEWVTPQWEILAEQYGNQMLREYDADGNYKIDSNYTCVFMTKKISALQENRTTAFNRALAAAKANVFTRDQALAEMGMDPIDNDRIYVGATIRLNNATDMANVLSGIEDQPVEDVPPHSVASGESSPAQHVEAKQFRAFAAKRIKEGHPEKIREFVWYFTPENEREELITELELENA